MTMVSQSRPPAGSPISPRSSLDRILPRRDVTAAGVITCGIARRSPFRHLAELLSDSRGALRLGGLIEGEQLPRGPRILPDVHESTRRRAATATPRSWRVVSCPLRSGVDRDGKRLAVDDVRIGTTRSHRPALYCSSVTRGSIRAVPVKLAGGPVREGRGHIVSSPSLCLSGLLPQGANGPPVSSLSDQYVMPSSP